MLTSIALTDGKVLKTLLVLATRQAQRRSNTVGLAAYDGMIGLTVTFSKNYFSLLSAKVIRI